MFFLRKKIIFILILLTLICLTLSCSESRPFEQNGRINSSLNIKLTANENSELLICNSSSGVCGPPPGWYTNE